MGWDEVIERIEQVRNTIADVEEDLQRFVSDEHQPRRLRREVHKFLAALEVADFVGEMVVGH